MNSTPSLAIFVNEHERTGEQSCEQFMNSAYASLRNRQSMRQSVTDRQDMSHVSQPPLLCASSGVNHCDAKVVFGQVVVVLSHELHEGSVHSEDDEHLEFVVEEQRVAL